MSFIYGCFNAALRSEIGIKNFGMKQIKHMRSFNAALRSEIGINNKYNTKITVKSFNAALRSEIGILLYQQQYSVLV